jgi:hypothetical protein
LNNGDRKGITDTLSLNKVLYLVTYIVGNL